MSKVKNALSSMAFAATLLVASGVAQFAVINLIKSWTGWTVPKWVAAIIAATAASLTIIVTLAVLGYSVPDALVAALKAVKAVNS